MKKIVSILLVAVMCCGMLVGCGEKKAKEYNIEEFGAIYDKIEAEFEEETEYYTDEEKYGKKGFEVYQKISEKNGLETGAEVIVSGIKKGDSYGLNLVSEGITYAIPCFFTDSDSALGVFIEDGEQVKISGYFSKDEKSIGCITDIKILSPEVEPIYEDNIADVVASLEGEDGTAAVCGTITDIVSKEEFKNMCDMLSTVELDESTFLFEKVAYLANEEAEGMIFFSFSPDAIKDLKEGDRVALYGDVESIMSLMTAEGTYETQWGLIDFVSEIYKFKE